MIPPKSSVLAGVGTEPLVAASGGSAEKPAATVGRGAAGGVNEACDFGARSAARVQRLGLPGSTENFGQKT